MSNQSVSLPIGCGLVNLGNTCYANTTLQCLAHCMPLFIFLLNDKHIKHWAPNAKHEEACKNVIVDKNKRPLPSTGTPSIITIKEYQKFLKEHFYK